MAKIVIKGARMAIRSQLTILNSQFICRSCLSDNFFIFHVFIYQDEKHYKIDKNRSLKSIAPIGEVQQFRPEFVLLIIFAVHNFLN